MTLEAWITLGVLMAMFALLIFTKWPAWTIFVGTLTVFMTLNLLPGLELASVPELLKGFSNPGVLTVAVLFMVAAGMYSTGAITLIADKIVGLPKSLMSAQLRIQPPVAVGSAFLNNTPLVAMSIPVIRDLTRTTQLAASKLFMPMSYSSILGGAATLIGTSTNLIIAGLVAQILASGNLPTTGIEEVTIFFPTPVALPAAVIGIFFLITFGVRLLPQPKSEEEGADEKRFFRAEFLVEGNSQLVGKTVEAAGFANPTGYELILLERPDGQAIYASNGRLEEESITVENTEEQAQPEKPRMNIFRGVRVWLRGLFRGGKTLVRGRKEKLEVEEEVVSLESQVLGPGDALTFVTESDALPALWATIGLMPRYSPVPVESRRYKHSLVEVITAPEHPAVGHLVSELPVREKSPYQSDLVALSRNGSPPPVPLPKVRIASGDNAVLEVDDHFFYENRLEREFLITKRLRGYSIQRTDRAITATVIILVMVAVVAFGWMSMLNAALIATFAMLFTGCMNWRTAGRAVEWDTVVVLAAAVGLESVVTASGLADVIANGIAAIAGDNAYVGLVAVFLGCIIMTNLITNAAAAAFMFPIALLIAADLGVSFAPFIVILMLGTSYAFINPAGYQTNLMVQRPGNYEFIDFVKVGVPLTIIAGVIAIILAPIVYPF